MKANVVSLPVRARLVCSACGAQGEGSCHCGANYVPWKEKAAADAVAKAPAKSNYVIAEEIGVSEPTVRRARKSTASSDAVAKQHIEKARTGKDGRTRRMPVKKKPAPPQAQAQARKGDPAQQLNQQVNCLLDRLGIVIDDVCDDIMGFLRAHPDLEQEGREAILHCLQVYANKLLNHAQTIDGR